MENPMGQEITSVEGPSGGTDPKPFIKKAVIIALVAAVLLGGYYYSKRNKALTPDEAQAKIVEIWEKSINRPELKIEPVTTVKENGLYKTTLKINGQEFPSYITMDGKTFFPEGVDVAAEEKKAEEAKKSAEIPKSDKPTVDLYVMSFCPYGNKAEDTLKPVYELLKGKVDFNFRYIVNVDGNKVSSLHGEKEVVQNEREACVLKNYGKDKWMSFVTYVNAKCGTDGACWQAGAGTLGINVAKVNGCVASEGATLMKTDADLSAAAGANGSPTMLINGVETKTVYQYGNSESYKQAICNAFNTAPEECAKALEGNTATSQGGSC